MSSDVVLCEAADVSAARLLAIRQMLDAAFDGRFNDDDWDHSLGGTHAMIVDGEHVLAHASVVPRTIAVGTRAVRVGYVEGVGVAPALHGQGLGSAVIVAINGVIGDRFELGMLSTGEWKFYERLGWERWRGPTWTVHHDGRRERTADEDDGIMAYRTERSIDLGASAAITCEHRAGDCW